MLPDDTTIALALFFQCPFNEVLDRVITLDRERFIAQEEVARLERRLALSDPKAARRERYRIACEWAPEAGRFRSAVLAALGRGKDWGIDEATWAAMVAKPCTYCGGPTGTGIGLDRQDNSVGYFVENVVPSCGPCNFRKGLRRTMEPAIRAESRAG